MNRQEILSHLKENPEVSVLIVGGGINGIGVFRDLALNGVDVLLVERGDFCSGASAASSHMAHGGIRYLENGEFRLVREAVRERNLMIRNAPHLVKPLPTAIPIFKRFSGLLNAPLKFFGKLDRPSERGSLVIKIGLMLYDAYTGRSSQRVVPRHKFLSRTASLEKWDRLNPAIVNTATYYDGAILQPERLAIEVLLDAEGDNPNARALNYVSMVGGMEDTVILATNSPTKTTTSNRNSSSTLPARGLTPPIANSVCLRVSSAERKARTSSSNTTPSAKPSAITNSFSRITTGASC